MAEVGRVEHKGRGEAIEHSIRRAIILGEIPPGDALRELDLAHQFGCAQGTIREALMRLSEEGLVARRPRRDTHVVLAQMEDAEEFLRIRHGIECRAAARIKATPALVDDLTDLLQGMRFAAFQGDEYGLLQHDCRFHLRLFEAAQTPAVEPVLQRCLVHTQRFKVLHTDPSERDLIATANRHQAILDALANGTLAAALSHHITTIGDFMPVFGEVRV